MRKKANGIFQSKNLNAFGRNFPWHVVFSPAALVTLNSMLCFCHHFVPPFLWQSHSHRHCFRRLLSLAMKRFFSDVRMFCVLSNAVMLHLCAYVIESNYFYHIKIYKYSHTQRAAINKRTRTRISSMNPFHRIQSIIGTNPVNKSNSKSPNDNV